MDMILLDWTRMGKTYCLAGAVVQDGRYRVIRPLLARYHDAPVRNVGWSAYQLDDTVWVVSFVYLSRGREQEARE